MSDAAALLRHNFLEHRAHLAEQEKKADDRTRGRKIWAAAIDADGREIKLGIVLIGEHEIDARGVRELADTMLECMRNPAWAAQVTEAPT